ncbi:MAG: KR domain-containing protein, partial [Actinomycetota bacterium]
MASRQEQLARLAREAITMLPGLGGSWFAARPGIFAADGEPGQVTLLLSAGTAPAGPAGPPPAMGAELSALAWLDLMGVRATTAMGQGLGEIAGLAWAESLPEADATRLARRCGEILGSPAVSPADADDRAARLRMLLTQFVFAPPRRRLISAAIGRQVMSPADIAEALCAQLSRPDRLEEALLEAAVDADLLVETGPGQALSAAAAQCCDVQAVSLGMGAGGAPAPRAIAALFAVGALGRPQSLYAGEPARPIDIWRERIFITSPCQLLPPRPAGVHSVPRPGGEQPESPAGTHPAGMVTATTGPKPAVPPAAIRHVATRAVTTPSGTAPQAIAAQATAAQAATTLPPAAAPLAATPQATAPSQTTASPVTESQATALPGAAAPPATAGTPRATAPLRPTIPSRAATAAWVAAATQAGPVPQAANTAQAAAAPQAATAQRVARPAGALPGVAAGASHAESQVTDRAVQEARAHRAGLALPAHMAGAQRHPVADPPRGGIPSSQDPQSSQDLQPGQDAQSSWSPWPGQDTESRQSAGASQLTGTSQSSGAGQLTGDGTDAAGLTSEEKHRRAQVPVIARAIATARRNPAKAAGPAEAHGATQTPGTAGEAEQTGQPEQITDTGQTTGTAQTAGTGQTTETAITTGTTDVTQAPMVTGAVAAASASRSGQAMAAEAATAGIATWTRCFAEELRLPRESLPLADGQPWRVWAAANHPFGIIAPELFPDRPGAGRTLAVLGAPNDPGACATALSAARDAVRTGQLVVISPSAGFTGFWASLHAEHPSMGITLIRVRAGSDGLRAASQYAAVTPGKFRELSIDHAGQPREAVMAPVPVPGGGTFPLGPEDVVLVSRGTQGAGLALAQVLACCGAPVAVIGEAGPDEDSKLVAGLERLRLAGARVIFETVDPTGPASLAAAMHRIQRKLGPVTAVGHAAPPAPPRLATELTEGELAAHVGTGAAGLQQLLSCIRTDRLRLIATFGSVAGRYGMAGESLLALASGAFAEQAERLSDAIPGCRALHIDWPGWAGSGLGERAGLAAGMARAKIAPLQVREGSRLLLKMLATPGLPGRIAVHGRIGAVAPAVIAAAGPTVAAPGVPGSPGGRFLENLLVHYPGIELVADARLALSTDPYLAEHRLDGELLLPAALALEAMAQAASALAGRPLHRAKGVSAVAPVLIPDSEPGSSTVIRICALRDGDTVWTAVRCAETGFDVDHFRAAFYCGEDEVPVVPVEAGPGELDDTDEPATHVGSARIIDGSELYGPVCFQSGRFRRVAFLPEISARGCRALASGSDDQPWFSGSGGQASAPLILGNPGLNDATMHVLQACVPHRRLTVAGCESVTFSGRETDGVAEIRAVATPTAGSQPAAKRPAGKQLAGKPPAGDPPAGGVPAVAQAEALGSTAAPSSPQPVPQQRSSGPRAAGPPADYCWDVDAVDLAGNLLVSWRGLRFRDGGPLTRTAAWPPLLLSVYLERCATALGLEDGLRVRVLCTQAEPAGETLAGAAGSLAPDSGPEAITLKVGPAPSAAGSWQLADPAGADPVRGPGL